MKATLLVSAIFTFIVLLAGCVMPPPGWSNREAIERLANEKAPVGSPKAIAEMFFRNAGIKWVEFPNANFPKSGKSIVGWADIKKSWPVTTSVGVSFNLGVDDKIESIRVIESQLGP